MKARLRARVLRRGRDLEIDGALEYTEAERLPETTREAIQEAYREGLRQGWWQGWCHALGRDPNASTEQEIGC